MRIALSLLALVAGGCSSWNVKSDYNPQASFSSYRTFAWLPPPQGSKEAQMQGTLVDQAIKRETTNDLAARGVQPAAPGERPDFYITYHLSKQQKAEVVDWGYDPYFWGGGPEVYTYNEGTLVMDFIDANNRKVFWRGAASHPVGDLPTSGDRAATAVDKVLQKYPPKGYAAAARPAG